MRAAQLTKKIALERVTQLFFEAEKTMDLALANRYVALARKITMKTGISMPRAYKRRYCKHCYSYFIPSRTCTVRITKKKQVSYFCFTCRKRTRYPFISEKKTQKEKPQATRS